MTAVSRQTRRTKEASGTDVPEGFRRCLASGLFKPREEMIRFVIGPENAVVPDLSEKLPGHGLWVSASPEAVSEAAVKNLFAKTARTSAKPSAELAEEVVRLLKKRCFDFMGLAKGAGVAVLGETQTEAALRANRLALYFHAPDAGRVLGNPYKVPECVLFSREDMGAAFGFDQIAYAGIAPHGVAQKLKVEIARLRAMTLNAGCRKV